MMSFYRILCLLILIFGIIFSIYGTVVSNSYPFLWQLFPYIVFFILCLRLEWMNSLLWIGILMFIVDLLLWVEFISPGNTFFGIIEDQITLIALIVMKPLVFTISIFAVYLSQRGARQKKH